MLNDAHRSEASRALNPQGLVPALEFDDGRVVTHSLAIPEYPDECIPEPPLLPRDPWVCARVRVFAQVIACDVYPLQNLDVLRRLRALALPEDEMQGWARAVIRDGLTDCAALIAAETGPFCFGDSPTLADVCLGPQLGNARRFGVAVGWPRLSRSTEVKSDDRDVRALPQLINAMEMKGPPRGGPGIEEERHHDDTACSAAK